MARIRREDAVKGSQRGWRKVSAGGFYLDFERQSSPPSHMKSFLLAVLAATLGCTAVPEREFDIDGPVEQHVWISAKAGQEEAFERTFADVFYPALHSQEGFISASLLREPGTADYIIRLAFQTEEQRAAWVHSDAHETAWPQLAAYAGEPTWEGLSLIHPK